MTEKEEIRCMNCGELAAKHTYKVVDAETAQEVVLGRLCPDRRPRQGTDMFQPEDSEEDPQ